MNAAQLKVLFSAGFAGAALGLGLSMVAPQKADSAPQYSTCYETVNDDYVCIHSVRTLYDYPNHKEVILSVNGGPRDVKTVYCDPAHRYGYEENAWGIACFQFNP